MSKNSITVLPFDQCRILKAIRIVSDHKKIGDVHIGTILYKRQFTQTYKCKEVSKQKKDYSYYNEYPSQSIFPIDHVDSLFLQAIRNNFPKSVVWSDLIITSHDQEKYALLQRKKNIASTISFVPDFSQVNLYSIQGKSYPSWSKKITIFADFDKKEFDHVSFTGQYNLRDKQIFSKLDEVEFV